MADRLRAATEALRDAGLETPRPEAEHLTAHALGVRWSELWARLRDPMPAEAGARLDELTARRAAGDPLAYVLGSAVFYGLELACGPGVLVPRPETESVVDQVLELLSDRPAVVVDVGCGTGAIALAVARHRPSDDVHATERSPEALRWARINLERTGLAVRLWEGDFFAPLPEMMRGRVDVVVSNPPYIPQGRSDLVASDVHAEPSEALYAGPTGDEVLERLVAESPGWLRPDGALVCEIGTPEQAARLAQRLSAWEGHGTREDHTGRVRVVWARGTP